MFNRTHLHITKIIITSMIGSYWAKDSFSYFWSFVFIKGMHLFSMLRIVVKSTYRQENILKVTTYNLGPDNALKFHCI